MKKFAFAAIFGVLLHLGSVLCQTSASRIAYVCVDGLDRDICTMNPDGSGKRKVTRTPEISERWPTWSPDGQWIAFAPYNPSKLVMTDPKGGKETLLRKAYLNNSPPTWSPEGTKIACTGIQKIIIFDIITGEEKELWPLDVKTDSYRDPAWSPDGREIAFAARHGRQRDIYVMNTDGEQVRRLTNSPFEDRSPAWSPDGRRIAFYSTRGNVAGIFVMEADGANLKRLTVGNHDHPAWSPDGTQIAFSMIGIPPRVGIMKANGQGLKVVAEGYHPSWQRAGVLSVEPMGKLPLIWGLMKSKLGFPQSDLRR